MLFCLHSSTDFIVRIMSPPLSRISERCAQYQLILEMSQLSRSRIIDRITLLQRKQYNCCLRVFCCKWMNCCKKFDFSLLTSQNRKTAFQKMMRRYVRSLSSQEYVIMDPFFILLSLLLGESSEAYNELMGLVANKEATAVFSKQDLQFYIPQLCAFLVFHAQMSSLELQKLLVRACKVDIHFSLKYYFYMRSLEVLNVDAEEKQQLQKVKNYNSKFRSMINSYYALKGEHQDLNKRESNQESAINKNTSETNFQSTDPNRISKGKNMEEADPNLKLRSSAMHVETNQIYFPILAQQQDCTRGLFQSTVSFFADLVQLSISIISSPNRKEQLMKGLLKINKQLKEMSMQLPTGIYIPFTKNAYQDMHVVNIVCEESRVFNTKERAPYYVCFESYFSPAKNEIKDRRIQSHHLTVGHGMRRSQLFEQDKTYAEEEKYEQLIEEDRLSQSQKSNQGSRNSRGSRGSKEYIEDRPLKDLKSQKDEGEIKDEHSLPSLEQINQKKERMYDERTSVETEGGSSEFTLEQLFKESEAMQFQRIRDASTYSLLEGYKLLHIIVKSFDDIRQENFAMQLLQQFNNIFKMQCLPVHLLPYQVLPLTHDTGIMECMKDSITIDELKQRGGNLKLVLSSKSRINKFIETLAGYSLVTYFLQVKDRHNGNIMIRRDGSIFHIDYGFFISNAPGKGVELQKNLPFKLTTEYVEAMGGVKSKHFDKFRKYFYQGYNACRKHQHRILILTKMIYSSFGKTMHCFETGNEAIENLETRFNPPHVHNDADMSRYCQDLINSSLDNWRSRWYDKWQYYMQGILY